MMRTKLHPRNRVAFTLIELLVVIAIIAVLMSLTTAAVMKMLAKGPEVQCRNDIGELAKATSSFTSQYSITSIPSSVVLCEDLNMYTTAAMKSNPTAVETSRFLTRCFGRRLGRYNNWSNRAGFAAANATNSFTLSGEQCLVYFLGGMQSQTTPYGCLGWSTDNTNPTAPGGSRNGPYFEFKSNRLSPVGGFYVYADPFGKNQPYVYLADRSTNDYRLDSTLVAPFRTSLTAPVRFVNQGGFQIISAGPNGTFGNSDTWTPLAGYGGGVGGDDFANFSRLRLGAPQE